MHKFPRGGYRKPIYRIEYPFYKCRDNDDNSHEFEFINDIFVRCKHCDGMLFLEDYDEYISRFDEFRKNYKWVI